MSDLVIARIGKPHGLRGEVTVQVHTDAPESRFVIGAAFATDPASQGPLTVRSARWHNAILLLSFEEAADRTAAENLRGTKLLGEDLVEEDAWYSDDLVGLPVFDTAGELLGTVAELHARPAQDLLEISLEGGRTAYVPFVEAIVPTVDIDAGRIVIDPPPGLLELGDA